ncbi:MAG: ABC transporter permease, partial [Gammaproteobacteria bacterium]
MRRTSFVGALALLCLPLSAWADVAVASPADTAWLLTATALVLFMTLPGLALFYAGLVRSKNALSVLINGMMGLPSVVVGVVVYLVLSRSGPFVGFGLLYTPLAMIIAQ